MRLARIVVVLALLLGVAAWAAQHWQLLPESRLMDRPGRVGQMALPPPASSFVAVRIGVDDAGLSRFATAQLPKRVGIPSRRIWQEPAKEVFNRYTGRMHLVPGSPMFGHGEIVRSAPVSVRAVGSGLDVSTSLDVLYNVTMKSLRSTTSAALDGKARVDYDIGQDWRPVLSISPSYEWTKPPSGRFFNADNVSYAPHVLSVARERFADLKRVLPGRVATGLPVQGVMTALWEISSEAIAMPLDGLWLDLQPKTAYFLPPSATDGGLQFDLGFAGEVRLGDAAPTRDAEAAPLPPPLRELPDVRKLRLPVPARLEYDELAEQWKRALAASPIVLNGGAVVVRDVEVYPAAPSLVLALRIDGDLPNRWLWMEPRGWIYLTATPRYDASQRELVLDGLALDGSGSNAARALAAALQGSGFEQIAHRTRLPVSNAIGTAIRNANQQLNYGIEGALLDTLRRRNPGMADLIFRLDVSGDLQPVRGPVTLATADDALWLFHPAAGDARIAITLNP